MALRRCLALVLVLLWALPAGAQPSPPEPNPELERARQLIEELRYADASRALEAALMRPGNDHDTLVGILELQGVVAGMLQQSARARQVFQTLLVLAPDHRLQGDYAPRVVTPFFEARAWVADQRAELRLEDVSTGEGPTSRDALVEFLQVQVTDTLHLGLRVRFHVSEDEAPWTSRDSAITLGRASVPVQGTRVRWWAQLLDEHEAVLGTVGRVTEPLIVSAVAPGTRVHGTASGVGRSPWRTAASIGLGVAVASGATGAWLGWSSREARATLAAAPVDERGLTTGLTQREAFALDARARSRAVLANVLFGVAGAAALAGGTFWILGTPVTVSATPGGVVVGGTLP